MVILYFTKLFTKGNLKGISLNESLPFVSVGRAENWRKIVTSKGLRNKLDYKIVDYSYQNYSRQFLTLERKIMWDDIEEKVLASNDKETLEFMYKIRSMSKSEIIDFLNDKLREPFSDIVCDIIGERLSEFIIINKDNS